MHSKIFIFYSTIQETLEIIYHLEILNSSDSDVEQKSR